MGSRYLVIGVLLANCVGCAPKTPVQTQRPVVLATVAGQPLSANLFDYYVHKKTGQSPDKVDHGLKERLLEELIAIEAAAAGGAPLVQPADKPEIELARLERLGEAAAVAAGVYRTPSAQELQAGYQAYINILPANEYHVAHILVATEALAVQAVFDLDHGANFSALARERSADDSNTRGGDLGWTSPGRLPKNFVAAVIALKPGQYTKRPLKTPYGWHVIKLIETRHANAPPYEQVKAQIALNLQEERRAKFTQTVVAKTTVERLIPTTPPN